MVSRYASLALVSLCGVGFLRPASATWGSAAAGIALYFSFPSLSIWIKLLCILIVFLVGWIATAHVITGSKDHDPHFVVIDELAGMMISCLFLPQVWWQFALAFVLFRIFDIAKLWPASFFDKQQSSFAVMIDDICMAIPTLACLHVILYTVT